MKKLIVFDLDGTIAESKSPVDPEMSALLHGLLAVVNVAIISGANWPQFETQLISHLPAGENLSRLSILPGCGTKFYRFDSSWEQLYSEDLSDVQKEKVIGAVSRAAKLSGFAAITLYGQQIEDRGSQITFSALGQNAPLEAKRMWDPDFSKRKAMKALLDAMIPQFSVRLGGTTSIDVTRQGIDKAYGIQKLRDILDIELCEMIFVGDALFPGGNDYPAEQTGVASIQVKNPHETKRVIEAITACLGGDMIHRDGEAAQ